MAEGGIAPGLADELIRRGLADQEARLGGDFDDAVLAVDRDNTAWLRDLLWTADWPRRSVIGDRAARAAWLLAQHAVDDAVRRRALTAMTDAVEQGEASASHLAYLVDRDCLLSGRPQRFGTQAWVTDSRCEIYPIENPETVDLRRAGMGLGPLSEYLYQLFGDADPE